MKDAPSINKFTFSNKSAAKSATIDTSHLDGGTIFDAYGPTSFRKFEHEVAFDTGVDTVIQLLEEYSKAHEIMCESDVQAFEKFMVRKAREKMNEGHK